MQTFLLSIAPFTIRIISRCFTEAETQSQNPQPEKFSLTGETSSRPGLTISFQLKASWLKYEKTETGQRELSLPVSLFGAAPGPDRLLHLLSCVEIKVILTYQSCHAWILTTNCDSTIRPAMDREHNPPSV